MTTIKEISALLQSGKMSCTELTRTYIEASKRHNPALTA
jgi:Asp-tRNA(Asn)/Glu-tRNA(Gln) amidotransferase A subunit family amidase